MKLEKEGIVLVYSHGAGQNILVDKLPEIGETLQAKSWDFNCDGGKGTNIAVGLARLGLKVSLITRVGDDVFADLANSWLIDAGVNIDFVEKDPKVRTSTGAVFVDAEGNNSIILSDGDTHIPHNLINEGLKANERCSIFITGFEIDPNDAIYSMAKAKELGMYTIINPSPSSKEFLFEDADLVVINEVEARQMIENMEANDYEAVAQEICKNYKCKNLIITLGSKGYLLNTSYGVFKENAWPVPIVDTSGAGDGFLLAVAYALNSGKSLEESCHWANLYSAISVGIRGTIPSYLPIEDVKNKMEKIEKGERK